MDTIQTGRAGEFYAAFILETLGIECHHVDREGADLWCKLPNDTLFTVQVKTAQKQTTSRKKYQNYRYNLKKSNFDYYCFVALDIKKIRILPRSKFPTQKSTAFKKEFFDDELLKKDLEYILAQNP